MMPPSSSRVRLLFLASLTTALTLSNAVSQTFTWDGGGTDDLFGTGANWAGDSTPGVGSGVILNFGGSTRPTPQNNYTTGDNFKEWHLLSGAGAAFTITGNGFGLFDKIENDAGSGQTLSINTAGIYARDGSIEINPVGGNINIGAPIELDGNASLNVFDGGLGRTLTLNGALSNGNGTGGNGSLVLNQTSTVILAADSDYGTTTLNNGTFLQVGAGGTTGTLGSGAVTNNGSLIFNRSNSLTVSNAISGTGSVTVTAGTIAFNNQKTYSGNTVINGGILDLTGGGGATGTIRGTATINTGGTLRLSAGDVTGYNTGSASLTTLHLTGGALNINTTSNQTLGGAVINMTAGSITGVANSNLDFFQGSSALNILSSANQSSISGVKINLRQNNGLTVNVADGAQNVDLLVSSVISNSAGFTNNTLKKTGNGTMQISGASTLNTGIEVQQGRLLVTGTLRDLPTVTVSAGAIAEFGATNIFVSGHGTAVASTRSLISNGGTLLMNSSFDSRIGNVTLNNGATWTSNRALTAWDALLANTNLGAATVSVTGTGKATMNGSGGIHLQGVQNFNVADTVSGAGVDLEVNMTLDNGGTAGGTGGIRKQGVGTMLLNGAMSYTGDTIVDGGILAVDGNQQSNRLTNNHLVTVNNTGTFEVRGVNALGTANNSIDVTVNAGGTYRVVSGGSAVLGASGQSHTHVRNLTLSGGTVDLSFSGGGSAYNNESVQLNGTLTVNGSQASTIQFGSGANTGNAGIALSGNRTFNVGDVTTGTDLFVLAEIENNDGGAGSITKTGAGTMQLSGSHSYSGTTTISEGSITLASGTTLATSQIALNGGNFNVSGVSGFTLGSGQSLTGNGSVTGNLAISGTLGIGTSPGTITFENDLALNSGSISNFEINGLTSGTFDLATAAAAGTQAVTFSGGTLNLIFQSGFNSNGTVKIFDFDSYAGSGFTTVNTSGLDTGYSASFDASTGVVTIVPEPSAALLAAAGSLGLAFRRRRRQA
ncbi:MAG: autotransporter-associated beta strand repeat-containing protein [Akkermansiaceae bacterium]|jgi:autotransporter-associated beta strand protein|nr:autotransporter-associated beta strand repeat-containing protein [Akkermansiaceae bacterium]